MPNYNRKRSNMDGKEIIVNLRILADGRDDGAIKRTLIAAANLIERQMQHRKPKGKQRKGGRR